MIVQGLPWLSAKILRVKCDFGSQGVTDWLKNNVHLGTWLSPIIALVGLIFFGNAKGGPIDWVQGMLYIGFLTCLAAGCCDKRCARKAHFH